MFGDADSLEFFEDESDHHYTGNMAKRATEFFSRHLLGKKALPGNFKISPLKKSRLQCTETGQVRGDFEDARFVYDDNLEQLSKLECIRSSMPEAERMEKGLKWLKERIYTGRKPCELNVRHFYPELHVEDFIVQLSVW